MPAMVLALGACGTSGSGAGRDGGGDTAPARDVIPLMDARPDAPATPDVQTPPPDVQTPPPDVQTPVMDVQNPPDAFDLCGMASTCEACTGLRGCGFCYGNGTCKPGAAGGPTDGNCGPSLWAFGAAATACWGPEPTIEAGVGAEPAIEPGPEAGSTDDASTTDVVVTDTAGDARNPCADSRACGDCTGRPECGWCAATAQCLVGEEDGPTGSTCLGDNWQYFARDCRGPVTGPDPCANYNTCGDCTPRAGCGFCSTDNTCRSGTASGSTRGGTCTGSSWAWVTSMCAAPADPCRAYGGCDTCAGDARCGWCANNNTCATASSTSTCSDGTTRPVRTVPQCVTAVDPCSLVRVGTGQCLACTAVRGCGLCRDGNRCLRGAESGPTRADACTPGNWVYSPFACL